MKYEKAGEDYILKIEKGEAVMETLTAFSKRENIKNATVSAIGAVNWISCGHSLLISNANSMKESDYTS